MSLCISVMLGTWHPDGSLSIGRRITVNWSRTENKLMRHFGFFVQDPHDSLILHRKGSLVMSLPPLIPASPCSPTFPFFRLLPAPLRQSTCLPSHRAHRPCSLVIPPTGVSSHGRPCEVLHLTLWLQGLDCYHPQVLSLPPCAA
jgi:hypothetical protein